MPNLIEFAGKPTLLVFPKVTGRAVSIMREVAGPSSLFLFPKPIIEGCLGQDSSSEGPCLAMLVAGMGANHPQEGSERGRLHGNKISITMRISADFQIPLQDTLQ